MSNTNNENSTPPATGLRLLPKGFSPSINEVIIGRGRKVTNHCGNERFRRMIYTEMKTYSSAENKTAKSLVIFRVLQLVKNGSSPEIGGFVKQDAKAKRWYAVEEATARATTAQAFRDALSSHYKSSKQFKQQRRWNRKDVASPTAMAASSGEVEILPMSPPSSGHPVMPLDFSMPSPGFPTVPVRQGLSDILDWALETTSQLTMPVPVYDTSMASPPCHRSHLFSCGENDCTKEVDLDTLFDSLGALSTNENPFEPTPISPTMSQLEFPTSAMNFVNRGQQQQQETPDRNGHFGTFWMSNKINQQPGDDCFWQHGFPAQADNGFTLKNALFCRHG